MENTIKTLENLGLNEKQAKVYLACLELGSGTIQEVAEKAGVKRTSIYNFLEELINRGLVSELKQDDRILLVAEDPVVLEKQATEELQAIQSLLPELAGIFNRPGNKPKVRFYQGIAGLKKIYEDTLETGQDIVAFSHFDRMMPVMAEYLWDYSDRRAAKGMAFRSIAPDGEWTRKVIGRNTKQKRELKIATNVNFETEINIYGNKVALQSFRRPYAGVIIEDIAIAQTLKSVWGLLWQNLK